MKRGYQFGSTVPHNGAGLKESGNGPLTLIKINADNVSIDNWLRTAVSFKFIHENPRSQSVDEIGNKRTVRMSADKLSPGQHWLNLYLQNSSTTALLSIWQRVDKWITSLSPYEVRWTSSSGHDAGLKTAPDSK